MFPCTAGVDLFPCCVDIHGIVSTHVERILSFINERGGMRILELAWRVFSEYESPDYSKEGTEEFRKCLHDEGYLAGIEYYGAFDGERLIGLVGIRSDKKAYLFLFCGREISSPRDRNNAVQSSTAGIS